jgi:subtilisin family serine protease
MLKPRLGFAAASVLALGASAWAADGDCRVIVACKGDADAAALKRHGVEVESVRGAIAAGKVAPGRIAELRADPDVAYVEEDGIATASAGKPAPAPVTQPAETTPWGVAKVWGTDSGNGLPTQTGAGVKVAVIDTGIDLDHPDLDGNVDAANSKTFVVRTSSATDDNGHGTHVAGTIAAEDNTIGVIGVAPQATLIAVKVLDKRGAGYWSDVAAGVDWARQKGANIANMSLGGGATTTMETACSTASGAGVLLVAAAGNSGDGDAATDELDYPGAYSTVVAVGATDVNDAIASFSNSNSDVEVSAPGVAVPSTYKGDTYATLSGTSMASPHAAGMAALLWQETGATATASSVRSLLHTRVRVKTPAASFGYGICFFPKP